MGMVFVDRPNNWSSHHALQHADDCNCSKLRRRLGWRYRREIPLQNLNAHWSSHSKSIFEPFQWYNQSQGACLADKQFVCKVGQSPARLNGQAKEQSSEWREEDQEYFPLSVLGHELQQSGWWKQRRRCLKTGISNLTRGRQGGEKKDLNGLYSKCGHQEAAWPHTVPSGENNANASTNWTRFYPYHRGCWNCLDSSQTYDQIRTRAWFRKWSRLIIQPKKHCWLESRTACHH